MITFSITEKENKVLRQFQYKSFFPISNDLIVCYNQDLDIIDLVFIQSGKILRIPNDVDLARNMFMPLMEQAFKEKILGFSGFLGALLTSIYRDQFFYINIENTNYLSILEFLKLFNQGGLVYSNITDLKYSSDMENKIYITDITESNKDHIKKILTDKTTTNTFYISEDISKIQIKKSEIKKNQRYEYINNFIIEYDSIIYDLEIFKVKR